VDEGVVFTRNQAALTTFNGQVAAATIIKNTTPLDSTALDGRVALSARALMNANANLRTAIQLFAGNADFDPEDPSAGGQVLIGENAASVAGPFEAARTEARSLLINARVAPSQTATATTARPPANISNNYPTGTFYANSAAVGALAAAVDTANGVSGSGRPNAGDLSAIEDAIDNFTRDSRPGTGPATGGDCDFTGEFCFNPDALGAVTPNAVNAFVRAWVTAQD